MGHIERAAELNRSSAESRTQCGMSARSRDIAFAYVCAVAGASTRSVAANGVYLAAAGQAGVIHAD